MQKSSNDSAPLFRHQSPTQEYLILGTAHISGTSVTEVENTIRELRPDAVMVELDPGRLESLRNPEAWRKLDIRQVVRNGQLPTLISNLVLASWQRRMGAQTGVRPGAELLKAVEVAEELNIPVILGDRPIRATLKRLWASVGWWQRLSLMGSLFASLFDKSKISEDQLQEMRQGEDLNQMLEEFGKDMPLLRQILIDERDATMSEHMQRMEGARILGVVGAAHAPGMLKKLVASERSDLASLEEIPSTPFLRKWAPAILSLAILSYVVYYAMGKSLEQLQVALWIWVACTSLPALLAALIARAHPLVVLMCTTLAPIAAFLRIIPGPKLSILSSVTQAWLRPPTVHDMETVADDVSVASKWWSNRLLRIALVFFLPGLATTLGALAAVGVLTRAAGN